MSGRAGQTVLVTRAEPGAGRTCERLRALGLDPVNAATARIRFLETGDALDGADALALTSINGAQALARSGAVKTLPVFTVGAATAEAAREAGFTHVDSADGDAPALLRLILKKAPPGLIVHARGRDQAFDLAAALQAEGCAARSVIVYAAEPVPALPPGAADALRAGALVLVHSQKGAERLLALCDAAGLREALLTAPVIAISRQAAAPLLAAGAASARIAASPDEAGLIAALTH